MDTKMCFKRALFQKPCALIVALFLADIRSSLGGYELKNAGEEEV